MARETGFQLSSEKRREERHTAHQLGRLRRGDKSFPLKVGDLSYSGALILIKDAPPVGAMAVLWIEDYGPIAIQVVRSGAYYCGVSFAKPAAHRLKLQYWLAAELAHSERKNAAAPLPADAA